MLNGSQNIVKVDLHLGCLLKDHNLRAAIRMYSNQTYCLLGSLRQRPNALQCHIYFLCVGGQCLNSVLIVKVLVGTFNQEKALVGAFSVIVKSSASPAGLSFKYGAPQVQDFF